MAMMFKLKKYAFEKTGSQKWARFLVNAIAIF